ncbi:Panacea domain-containing protein [Candidatus Phytoplasma fraxini]|uniref:Antitoxin SocA-like Panacea domain-containing protein n=1 Tax=Ash yellows phytoplasma TaxID=35780 RepID=A0ABZ2U8R1_ASHYP
MKLQKLVYYAYAYYLVENKNEKKLIDTPNIQIEAWPYGPVFPTLYFKFRNYGAKSLTTIKEADSTKLDKSKNNDKKTIDYILNLYKDVDARDLSYKTHLETPSNDAFIDNLVYDENIIQGGFCLFYYVNTCFY